jgi:hypothetical protein
MLLADSINWLLFVIEMQHIDRPLGILGSPRVEGGGGCSPAAPPTKRNLKNTDFVDTMLSKGLRDFPFSLHEPLKSADDWYIGILKNVIKTYKIVDYFFLQLVLIFLVT